MQNDFVKSYVKLLLNRGLKRSMHFLYLKESEMTILMSAKMLVLLDKQKK